MTTIRTARPDEIPALIQLPEDEARNAATAAYLADLLAKECTRPEWCLLATDGGTDGDTLVGSAVLWALPGHPVPSDVVLLEAVWDDPNLTVGRALLDEAVTVAGRLGATALGHVIDSPAQPPQVQYRPERRAALLDLAGFTRIRDGRRFRWLAGSGVPADDPRLTFRSLAELGDEPFVALLADVLADTRDARLAADVAERGPRGAAELLFSETKELSYEAQWWELGFAADGTPAVVSLPAHSPSFPVIGFIGVAGRHRGKGYAASAVARGTRVLAAAGATEIRGDADAANVAMLKGFARAGYDNFANRVEYSRPISLNPIG